nr:transcription initiation factor IIB family protein [Halobacterium salinarum]
MLSTEPYPGPVELYFEYPDEIRQRARYLAEQAEERGVTTGVHPAGFAAACLYKAGQKQGKWMTQSDVAESGNVTSTTLRPENAVLRGYTGMLLRT